MFNGTGYLVFMVCVMMDDNAVFSDGAQITPQGIQSVWVGCLTGFHS